MNEVGRIENDRITVCPILGVNIAVTNFEETLSYIQNNLKALSGMYICISNVHTTIMSQDDSNYMKIQNGAIMALPDGGPLCEVQRKRGFLHASRVTGPDLMKEIFRVSVKNGYRHFFYGSTEKVLDCLKGQLQIKYPGIQIVGMYSPPFRSLSAQEDADVLKHINEAKADFIWIGLGAPKQERWMATHQGKVAGLMIGVGAGFNYHAGILKRAPGWMQKRNMEWIYRLMQEPGRLFKRYLITNTRFVALLLKENRTIQDAANQHGDKNEL